MIKHDIIATKYENAWEISIRKCEINTQKILFFQQVYTYQAFYQKKNTSKSPAQMNFG